MAVPSARAISFVIGQRDFEVDDLVRNLVTIDGIIVLVNLLANGAYPGVVRLWCKGGLVQHLLSCRYVAGTGKYHVVTAALSIPFISTATAAGLSRVLSDRAHS